MGHASQESLKVAKKFVERKEGRSPLTCIGFSGYGVPCSKDRRVTTNGDAIYSYGWWKIAEFDDTVEFGGVWVTEDRYITDYWPVSGRPKYSPTTDGHIDAVKQELGRAGFSASDTVEGRSDGNYRLWVKE